jgi:hypothetical protein
LRERRCRALLPGTMKVILQDIKKVQAEALVVGFFEEQRPLKGLAGELDWLLCGALSELLIGDKLSGALGDVALLTSQGKVPASKIFLIGLGPSAGFSASTLREAGRTAAACMTGAGVATAAMECFHATGVEPEAGAKALREGLLDGCGRRDLSVSLLARDAAEYERLRRQTTA